MSDATVRVKPLGEQWHTVGTGRYQGVWPEGLALTSDQWGPRSAGFTLRRRPGALFPDLLARTPVEIEVAGVLVWSGRITDTPEQDGDQPAVGVRCEGWQYHLDDDVYEHIYVHNRLEAWRDSRSYSTAPLGRGGNFAAGQVNSGDGLTLMIPDATAVQANDRAGVLLDLGPNDTAPRISIDYRSSNNNNIGAIWFEGYSVDSPAEAGAANFVQWALTTAGTGPSTGSFTMTAKRYVLLRLRATGAFTTSGDAWITFDAIRVYTSASYESGNQSALTATVLVTDALARGTSQLSPDLSGIGTTTLAFPEFAADGPRTAREQIATANAPHNWITKIDERKQPIFKARPTSPLVEIGEWAGGDFANASSNSAEDIVTKVIVRGQGPDQQPLSATRTQTGTIVDRQGGVAAKILDSGFALTTTFAQALGDTYLLGHRTSPLKGQSAITADGARRVQGGESVHPAHLLPLTGELMRLAHRTDPDTGAHSRTGTIAQVNYQHDTVTASVDIDNTRSDFEALQTRLGLVVPA